MGSEPEYRLRPCREIDASVSWLRKSRASSLHYGSTPWERIARDPSGRKSCGYSATDFRTPGYFHPPKAWWRDLTVYVLAHFDEDLERLNLHKAVRATCYVIQMSVAYFYAIFELYCPVTGTFFTPIGELIIAHFCFCSTLRLRPPEQSIWRNQSNRKPQLAVPWAGFLVQ